jgi:hypothetical protein
MAPSANNGRIFGAKRHKRSPVVRSRSFDCFTGCLPCCWRSGDIRAWKRVAAASLGRKLMRSMSASGHELPPHFQPGCPLFTQKLLRRSPAVGRLLRARSPVTAATNRIDGLGRRARCPGTGVNFLQKLYQYDPFYRGAMRFLSDEYCYDGRFEKHG